MFASSSVFVIILCTQVSGSNILSFTPGASLSHQLVFRPLTHTLAEKGHNLTIVTPDPAFPKNDTPTNVREIDVHDVSYEIWRDYLASMRHDRTQNNEKIFKESLNLINDIFYAQVIDSEVQEMIKTNDFELVLAEACAPVTLVLSHVFKTPVIQISSLSGITPNYQNHGVPSHALLYPNMLNTKLNNLSLFEKFRSIYLEIFFQNIRSENKEDSTIKSLFGAMTLSLEELGKNVDMIFLNTYHFWENNRPIPPAVIYMGGIYQKPAEELSKELQEYLDSSKNGVIYVSFGTNLTPSTLPELLINMLIKVLGELPYEVIFKWDLDEMPNKPSNFILSKWFPQGDLLKHPNMKLFITQAGLQSTEDSILAGVPLVAIPMFGDQFYNAEKYVYHKIGLNLDHTRITEMDLKHAINEVILNPTYRQNIQKLRDLMLDQPQTPLERTIWWTEYVLRHKGAKHLRSPQANITWTEYLILDVLAISLGIIFVFLLVVVFLMRILIKRLRRSTQNSYSKKVGLHHKSYEYSVYS